LVEQSHKPFFHQVHECDHL